MGLDGPKITGSYTIYLDMNVYYMKEMTEKNKIKLCDMTSMCYLLVLGSRMFETYKKLKTLSSQVLTKHIIVGQIHLKVWAGAQDNTF